MDPTTSATEAGNASKPADEGHASAEQGPLPPLIQAFLDQASPPPGQGNDYLQLNWTVLLLFVPFVVYLLALVPIRYVNEGLTVYSMLAVAYYCFVIAAFKENMAFTSNPVDFVKVELINLLSIVALFGLGYHFLSLTSASHFGKALGVVDGVYFSFVTIATVGFGDISPSSPLAKCAVMAEIAVGAWFFVTVIPVAVADQAERLRHFRSARARIADELRAAIDRGEIPVQRQPPRERHSGGRRWPLFRGRRRDSQ